MGLPPTPYLPPPKASLTTSENLEFCLTGINIPPYWIRALGSSVQVCTEAQKVRIFTQNLQNFIDSPKWSLWDEDAVLQRENLYDELDALAVSSNSEISAVAERNKENLMLGLELMIPEDLQEIITDLRPYEW